MDKRTDLKQKITDAAGIIFDKLGFRKASMDEIAMAVKKKKSSIYYYFTSKEEVFSAVVLQEAKVFRTTIMQAVEKETNPQEKLKAFVLTRMQIIDKLGNFNKALKDKRLMHLEFVERLKRLYDKEEVRLFKNILTEGVNSGFFQIYDIDLAATAIITSMRGMESTFLNSKNDPELDKRIDGVIYTILYGIVKR
ncbi:MAG: TetR/AcrR family transcriptional regulator [Bacteroidales bacterium]|nr:TetR/AcrR family transcriptional regulator [Bacteroidales bacterium]MBN2757750.1 TetR/AcrR family transcriptional regulator [Bacteroidales bacterium]